jgi:long-chain acyl-CoA synthetase
MKDLFELKNAPDFVQHGAVHDVRTVNAEIDRLAATLDRYRVSRSRFVYLFAPNHIKTIIAHFAILRAGLIAVLVDPEIGPLELEDMVNDAPTAARIFVDPRGTAFDDEKEIEFCGETEISFNEGETDDVCTMVYTAAEEGRAKGAMLTKMNLYSNAKGVAEISGLSKDSVVCALLPYHHLFGLQCGVLGPILAGATVLIPDLTNGVNLKGFVEGLSHFGVTHLYTVPSILRLLCLFKDIGEHVKTVEMIGSGGHKLSESIYVKFLERTGKEIREGYGTTEAAPICTFHRPANKVNLESVGPAFWDCEISIRDSSGRERANGEIGEIWVSGPNVMKGYFNRPNENGSTLHGRWLRTADLGRMDSEKYVYLTGRRKRFLNVGGKNVYPAEVERYLKRLTCVKQAKIFSEKQGDFGDEVGATIELNTNDRTVENFVKHWLSRNVSRHKIPRSIHFH